jgi:hypothetical protein
MDSRAVFDAVMQDAELGEGDDGSGDRTSLSSLMAQQTATLPDQVDGTDDGLGGNIKLILLPISPDLAPQKKKATFV